MKTCNSTFLTLSLIGGISAGFWSPPATAQQQQPQAERRGELSSPIMELNDGLEGSVTFVLNEAALDAFGLRFVPHGYVNEEQDEGQSSPAWPVSFEIDPMTWIRIAFHEGRFAAVESGVISTCGALWLDRAGERVVWGNLTIHLAEGQSPLVESTLHDPQQPDSVFLLQDVMMDWSLPHQTLHLVGALTLTSSAAAMLDVPHAHGVELGTLEVIVGPPRRAERLVPQDCAAQVSAWGGVAEAASTGPDVLVADLQSTIRLGHIDDITAYAIGTTACNIGTQRASWIAYTNQHPVILQNLYRLDQRGFQQIGMSWIKHGFYAVSQSMCSQCTDFTDGSQLGVGCSDPYSASLNGAQNNMSPRAIVNAHTGYFPYPYSVPGAVNSIHRRLQVRDADLNPTSNPNARYFMEGHYVTADDAAAGNQDNNASYREVRVTISPTGGYLLAVDSTRSTRRGQAALRAWRALDMDVVETDIRVPTEGLFILAAKAIPAGPIAWRYDYALQNLNSDRSARAFSVPLPPGAVASNVTFHDVDHHSGEPFDTTDWSWVQENDAITWFTQTHAENQMANALRYDSVFSFSFECNATPQSSLVTVSLFKPGFPESITGLSVGPYENTSDCNDNLIDDACDINCAAPGCVAPCGESPDCNANERPDECEPDCNLNGIADECDLRDCVPGDLRCADCNDNNVPDECEEDCDDNDIPDACVPPEDSDADGVNNCFDLCPLTTSAGACACPAVDRCCFHDVVCLENYPRFACIEQGGTPGCTQIACRFGCIIGDSDGDGDLDGDDFAIFLSAFGCRESDPNYDSDADIDEDGTVTLVDYQLWLQAYRGFVGNSQASAPLPGVLGDLDADGDVDLRDFADLQSCVNLAPDTSLLCIVKFDFDDNRRVDLDDLAAFQEVFRGPQR